MINGKSAIEWIMECYQITTHKESCIINAPNDKVKEHNKPPYIFDFIHSFIDLSVQTVDIVNRLSKI